MKQNQNLLLMTDVYKLGHLRMYKPGTTKIYSYLCARSTKKEQQALFFGLQPYLKLLERGVSKADAEEFFGYFTEILGSKPPEDIVNKINALVALGYIPLEIKAVPEGTVLDNKNVLATVTNTHPDFYWVVGFFESLLLKVWNTTSVATLSHKFKRLATQFTKETSDSDFLLPFLIHDFGYRGVSSEATAELSGAAHLVNFAGTDTVCAVKFVKENYGATGLVGASVPASEHSIHCSFGPTEEDELEYINNMMDLNPTGLVSVVSDAYDYWRMLTKTLPKVKDKINARDGKYVVRPDSGDPLEILCGNPNAPVGSPEHKGTFVLLEELFGATVNSKGYKELNPKIGVIYGDGMYFARYEMILNKMKEMGYANTNLVVGIGGLLLQQHNRDDLGFAFKATYAEINGKATELYKDPITDPGKKSHMGLMTLVKENGKYVTKDHATKEEERTGELKLVFMNGKLVNEQNFQEIRERSNGN
jgi:nicotinamide phosphoribosyltransferase